jgi:hypothetical protein
MSRLRKSVHFEPEAVRNAELRDQASHALKLIDARRFSDAVKSIDEADPTVLDKLATTRLSRLEWTMLVRAAEQRRSSALPKLQAHLNHCIRAEEEDNDAIRLGQFIKQAIDLGNPVAVKAALTHVPKTERGAVAREAIHQLHEAGNPRTHVLIPEAFADTNYPLSRDLLSDAPTLQFSKSAVEWAHQTRRPEILKWAMSKSSPFAVTQRVGRDHRELLTEQGIDEFVKHALETQGNDSWLEIAVDNLVAHSNRIKRSDSARHAVQTAAMLGESSILKRLSEGGVSLDLKDAKGDTPLLRLVRFGPISPVRTLLAAGANPNARGANQETALHLAARHGHAEMVELLLSHGANKSMINAPHLGSATPYEVARQAGHRDLMSKLRPS